jgi:hypothetical protein
VYRAGNRLKSLTLSSFRSLSDLVPVMCCGTNGDDRDAVYVEFKREQEGKS